MLISQDYVLIAIVVLNCIIFFSWGEGKKFFLHKCLKRMFIIFPLNYALILHKNPIRNTIILFSPLFIQWNLINWYRNSLYVANFLRVTVQIIMFKRNRVSTYKKKSPSLWTGTGFICIKQNFSALHRKSLIEIEQGLKYEITFLLLYRLYFWDYLIN